ncbi:hypothetical protein [Lelliottia amnigena]|uniref:hypothetical protein n=1 Tax=Lelliottia amnigena TaxID=61646 RepID=UPI004056119A
MSIDISKHPLIKQAYEVCQAIEKCGASTELTDAVTKASALMQEIANLTGRMDELEAAENRIAELTGKPAEEYADDGELLFEIDFCDDLSTSIQTAQWLKELRIRRAAGISVKGE